MSILEPPLEQTQRHVNEVKERIAKQEALVKRLERAEGGEHAMLSEARKFLADMHAVQQMGEEHLVRELEKLPREGGHVTQ